MAITSADNLSGSDARRTRDFDGYLRGLLSPVRNGEREPRRARVHMWRAYKGATYEEVADWLLNFVNSHAKRESPRVEGVLETAEELQGKSYSVRLRLGDRLFPPADQPPEDFPYLGVSEGRTRFRWCDDLARRVRGWARELLAAEDSRSKSV